MSNIRFVFNDLKMEKDKEDKEPKLELDIDLSKFSISKKDNGQHPFLHRIEGFLRPKEIVNQQKRRDEVLKRQKAARRNLVNYARQLAGFKPSKEAEDEYKNAGKSNTTPTQSPSKIDYNATEINISNNIDASGKSMEEEVLVQESTGDKMDVQKPRVNKREQNRIKEGLSYKDQLMMPEFLSEIPPDFAEKWVAMPFPQGQRCLLISAKGRTLLIRRNGTEIAHFPCRLPGGSQKTNVRESMFTLFDCIFVEQALTIYVIDVLAWKGDVYYDYNTEFRMSWRDWKLAETEDLTVLDQNNIYKLVAMPYYPCTVSGLQSASTDQLPYAREGYLFYHQEATYEFGLTPAMGVIHAHVIDKLVQSLQGTRPRENWFEDAQDSATK